MTDLDRYYNYLLTFLITLIPFALLTGPALPDVIVSLAALIFLFISIKNQEYKYYKNFISKFFFILCLFFIINSLMSEFAFFSLRSSLFYFRFILFSLAIWYLLDNDKNFLKYFLYSLIICYFIAIGSGVYQYLYGETIFGAPSPNTRLILLFSDNAALGHFLSRLFPLLVGLLIVNFNNSLKYYFLVFFLFISTDVLVYLSGERTSLALMFLSSVFIFVLMSKLKLFRLITLIFSMLIIVLISIYIPEVKERNIDRTIQQLGINENSEKINIFSKLHETYILTGLEMFKQNPLIGLGANNYRNYCNDYNVEESSINSSINPCSTHPHNIYIQLLAETGIIGFLLIMGINYFLFKTIMSYIYRKSLGRELNLNDFQICLIACFICTLWPLLPTHNFFNNWINIIFYLPLGFFLHTWFKATKYD
tara:strand:+ start:144 stop:1412 length:1269 start_codon:yes stop_codon:yes gene_type:complete